MGEAFQSLQAGWEARYFGRPFLKTTALQKPVISTEAEAGQRAERSGETSNLSSRGRRRWGSENTLALRAAFARRGKVRGFSTPLRPLARLRFGRNDRLF